MSKRCDITGQRFGMLTVIRMIYNEEKKNYSKCECLCDCGNTVIKDAWQLRHAKQEPSCGCNIRKINIERFSKKIEGQKFGRLLVEETIWDEVPKVRCLCDCGNEVILRRNDVMSGHTKSCGCYQKEVMREINRQDDSDYVSDFGVKIIEPYQRNNKNQMEWVCKCGFCGKTFIELPARIKNNHVRSCGCLNSSSMEKFIENLLIDLNIDYIPQYSFFDCVNDKGNKLRFDFAIIKDSEVFYLIEYDGAQHYKVVDYFGGQEAFELRQKYDNIKNLYCQNNNIPLLRLPYYLTNEEIKDEIINVINP